ncbi:hypothetical protein ABK040_004032 [Willaertia magna]
MNNNNNNEKYNHLDDEDELQYTEQTNQEDLHQTLEQQHNLPQQVQPQAFQHPHPQQQPVVMMMMLNGVPTPVLVVPPHYQQQQQQAMMMQQQQAPYFVHPQQQQVNQQQSLPQQQQQGLYPVVNQTQQQTNVPVNNNENATNVQQQEQPKQESVPQQQQGPMVIPTVYQNQYAHSQSLPQQQPMIMMNYPNMFSSSSMNNNNNNASTEPIVTQESYVPPTSIDSIAVLLANFLIPGLGHALIGQFSKAITYFMVNTVLAILIGVLSIILIGFALIPFQIVYFVYILVDGYKCSERLKKGYPVMKGECYSRVSALFVNYLERQSPVFVVGEGNEPIDWKQKCQVVDRQLTI